MTRRLDGEQKGAVQVQASEETELPAILSLTPQDVAEMRSDPVDGFLTREEVAPIQDAPHHDPPESVPPDGLQLPATTNVITGSEVINEEVHGFEGPHGTRVMAEVPQAPPPLPESMSQRERMAAEIAAIAEHYTSHEDDAAAEIPARRKRLIELFDESMAEEWFAHAVSILRMDPRLRAARCELVFARAYREEHIGVCRDVLAMDGWNITEGEYDRLARRFALDGDIVALGALLGKNGVTPAYRKYVISHLQVGASAAHAVEALIAPLPMSFRTRFRVLPGNVLGFEIFGGSTFFGRVLQWFRGNPA